MTSALNVGRMRPIAGKYKFRNSAFLPRLDDTRITTSWVSMFDAEHITASASGTFGGRDVATTDDVFTVNASGTFPSRIAADSNFGGLPSLDLGACTDFSFRSRGIFVPYAAPPGSSISILMAVYYSSALLSGLAEGASVFLIHGEPAADPMTLRLSKTSGVVTVQFRIQNGAVGNIDVLSIPAVAGAHVYGITYDKVSNVARIWDNSLSALDSGVQLEAGQGLQSDAANTDRIHWMGDHNGQFCFTGKAQCGALFYSNMVDSDKADIWSGLISDLGEEIGVTITA